MKYDASEEGISSRQQLVLERVTEHVEAVDDSDHQCAKEAQSIVQARYYESKRIERGAWCRHGKKRLLAGTSSLRF